jgi:hypothetical protein
MQSQDGRATVTIIDARGQSHQQRLACIDFPFPTLQIEFVSRSVAWIMRLQDGSK